MDQLSGIDNIFLADEEGNVYNHVAALGIYDPSTSPNGRTRFKEILQHFQKRLSDFPIFSRRPVFVPYGLDRPYWVEDQEIDVEFHIRHLALPKPGDWRQLMIQVARLHSRPLDRNRPLWEIYVIEGLDNIGGLPEGCFALFIKFHHASVDGHAGAEVIKAVHALAPLEVYVPTPREPGSSVAPSTLRMLGKAAQNSAGRMVDLSGTYLSTASKLGSLVWKRVPKPFSEREGAGLKLPSFSGAPKTRFGRRVSPHRVVDAVTFPLAQIKGIRQRLPGITINDIFMSVSGGALREYLNSKGELPDVSLRGAMPISLHGKVTVNGESGNNVGGAVVELGTDIEGALERLQAVHHAAKKAKDVAEELGFDLMHKLVNALPEAAGRALIRGAASRAANLAISNVRGPDAALYVAGAKLLNFYPVSIATDNVGLNITGFSYNGVLSVCFVACRDMMADPGYFSELLQKHFDELCADVAALDAPKAPSKAKVRSKPKAVTSKAPVRAAANKAKPLPAKAATATPKAGRSKVVRLKPTSAVVEPPVVAEMPIQGEAQ